MHVRGSDLCSRGMHDGHVHADASENARERERKKERKKERGNLFGVISAPKGVCLAVTEERATL